MRGAFAWVMALASGVMTGQAIIAGTSNAPERTVVVTVCAAVVLSAIGGYCLRDWVEHLRELGRSGQDAHNDR